MHRYQKESKLDEETVMFDFLKMTAAFAALVGMVSGLSMAQTAGTLDPTFGTGGLVTTSPSLIGGNPSTLTAIEEANGDIAVVTGLKQHSRSE
jgi:hypothetical protein